MASDETPNVESVFKNCSTISKCTSYLFGSLESTVASDEILNVERVFKSDGEYALRCPHCKGFLWVSETDIDEIRGHQYQHSNKPECGGWIEVDESAWVAGEVPAD